MTIYPERWSGWLGRFVLDLLVLAWTGGWVLAGWLVYHLVTTLEVVADAISSTGRTFDEWARAFQDAVPGNVPGVSGALHGLAAALQRSGGAPLIHRGGPAPRALEE